MNNNIVYVKTENGIFKCYKSEQMNKPIYYPVNNSGFINYNDVEKILTIDDFFEENQKLKSTLELYKGSLHREHEAIHKANDLEEENQELKRQLEYLRSGEYLNQLKFERDMLQYIIDNGEVSKEDKTYIDCTHRNTKLLAQQKEYIEQLEKLAYQNMVPSDFANGCKVAYGIALNRYKEIIGGDNNG